MEQQIVTGIAYSKDEAQITLRNVADKPGVAASIFVPLAEANINVDMIVQSAHESGDGRVLTFTVPTAALAHAVAAIERLKDSIGFEDIRTNTDVVKVSAVGVGMRSNAGIAAKMFATLGDRGINIIAITTSEIKVSVLIHFVDDDAERGPEFDVYVARSFAHYLWTWLEDAGREYGVQIAPAA